MNTGFWRYRQAVAKSPGSKLVDFRTCFRQNINFGGTVDEVAILVVFVSARSDNSYI